MFACRAIAVLLLLTCAPGRALAADPQGSYAFRNYGAEQGLRNQAVTSLASPGRIFSTSAPKTASTATTASASCTWVSPMVCRARASRCCTAPRPASFGLPPRRGWSHGPRRRAHRLRACCCRRCPSSAFRRPIPAMRSSQRPPASTKATLRDSCATRRCRRIQAPHGSRRMPTPVSSPSTAACIAANTTAA